MHSLTDINLEGRSESQKLYSSGFRDARHASETPTAPVRKNGRRHILWGGLYREVVLAKDKETTIDYVVNDPVTVKFEFIKDKDYGEIFELIRVNRDGTITRLEGDPTISIYAKLGREQPFWKTVSARSHIPSSVAADDPKRRTRCFTNPSQPFRPRQD